MGREGGGGGTEAKEGISIIEGGLANGRSGEKRPRKKGKNTKSPSLKR